MTIRWQAVVDWYFRFAFIAAAGIGAAAYQARIANYEIIPWVILVYSLVLIPRRLPRLLFGYGVLALFPVAVWYNGYGYVVAMQCWLPVLLNFFFVCLEKPDLREYLAASAFHLAVLAGLFAAFPHPEATFDALGAVTNAFAACILAFFMGLWIENRRLSALNQAMAESSRGYSQGLKRVMGAFIHDLAPWIALARTGLSLSQAPGQELHDFIRRGIQGAYELAYRVKEIILGSDFKFLDDYPLVALLAEVKASVKAPLAVHVQIPPALQDAWIHTDKGFFQNALLNLADNAGRAEARNIAFSAEYREGRIDLSAADDGKGFPEEILRDVFRHPLPSRNGGSGSGLLNSKLTLAFTGADIHLVDANTGGAGKTCIRITGIRQAKPRGQE